MPETFFIKQHDLQPYYYLKVEKADGSVLDIAGATIYVTMKNVRTGTVVTSRQAAVVSSGAGGMAEYHWVASDTVTPGKYNIEFEINPGAGGKFTVPANPDEVAEVIVLDDLDGQ
jgi:hypothetical protein